MKKIPIVLLLVLLLAVFLAGCGPIGLRPEVREGRFDFSITYELNGREETFSAVYVCEYDGVSWSIEGGDFSRDWQDRVEGNHGDDDYSTVIGTTEDGGDIVLFFGIYPEYFMGDSTGDRGAPEPSVYVAYTEGEDEYRLVAMPEEVEALCGARIIRYEYDAPIVNSFGLFH